MWFDLRPKSTSGIKEKVLLTKIERLQRWHKNTHTKHKLQIHPISLISPSFFWIFVSSEF